MFVKSTSRLMIGVLALAAFHTSGAIAGENTATGSLTVQIEGVHESTGPLYVSVQTKDDYQQPRHTAGGIYKDVKAGTLTYTYAAIPAGDYAISLWHDLDNDGAFTMGDNYRPLDGWGASGKTLTGAPTFNDVKITVSEGSQTQQLKMVYPD